MRRMLLLFVCLALTGSPSAARAGLLEYVKRPEPAFTWKLEKKVALPQGTVYDLHLISQVWQGITWEHQLQVYQPTGVQPHARMLLWNQGGSGNLGNMAFGMSLAQKVQAPVAFLYHIPNQPLFDGKKEDTLIAETFVHYLSTKDDSWPLLFPMVKSLVKAMDALQAFSKEEWKKPVEQFIVSGGSKRGWTSWLTAAADPRVRAIAPLVIDTLNFRAQMPHQLESFGKYSEQIADYTARGLVPLPDTDEAKKLWAMVDPWIYRKKLELPKMIINGANDPYWSVDALNLYWDDLVGDKWVLYVPNAGHNLQQKLANGKTDRNRAVDTLAAFTRHQIQGTAMPTLRWKHSDSAGKARLDVEAAPAPAKARLWVAEAPTRDFRQVKWVEQTASLDGRAVVGSVDPPQSGYRAFFAEMDYELDGLTYHLSTQLRVLGGK